MDVELHRARIGADKEKVTYEAVLRDLPDGCLVHIDGSAYLVLGESLLLWSPSGYTRRDRRPRNLVVTVLTPKPIVACFRKGYRPEVHETARRP
jgi:hypothetical protein